MNSNIEKIYELALSELTNDKEDLLVCLERIKNTDIAPFVHRVLEWRADACKSIQLYSFLSEVVNVSPVCFFDSLYCFIELCLLGSKPYHIVWYKHITNDIGEFIRVETTKEDPESRPSIKLTDNDIGYHDGTTLLEAMDILEFRRDEEHARWKESIESAEFNEKQ